MADIIKKRILSLTNAGRTAAVLDLHIFKLMRMLGREMNMEHAHSFMLVWIPCVSCSPRPPFQVAPSQAANNAA